MRLVKFFFILFIFTGISLYIFRLPLLETLVTRGLAKAGAQNTYFQLEALGLSQTGIKALNTTFPLADGKIITLNINDISLEYSLQQLLNAGKLQKITIEQMEIRQQYPAEKINKPFTLPKTISLGSNALRQKNPVQKLQINTLQLTGDWPAQIRKKNITLAALFDQKTISANLVIQINPKTQLRAEAESSNAHHAKVLLTAKNQQQAFLHNTFLLDNNALSGTIDMQLFPLRALALEQADIQLPPVSGQLTGNFSLPFPLQHDSQIHTDLTLTDTRGYTVTAQAKGNPVTRQLNFTLNGSNPESFLATTLKIDSQQISGVYQIKAAVLRRFMEPYFSEKIPLIQGNLTGTFALPFPLTGDGVFAIATEVKEVTTPWITGSFIELALKGKKSAHQITLDNTSLVKAANLQYGKYTVAALQLALGSRVSTQETGTSVLFNNKQFIQLTNLSLGSIAIDKVHGQTNKPLRISLKNNTISLAPAAIALKPMQVTEHSRTYSFNDLQLDIRKLNRAEKALQLTAAISTPGLVYHDGQRTVPLKECDTLITLDKDILTAELQFSPQSVPGRFQLAVTHDMVKGKGSMQLRTSKRLNLDDENITLAHLYTPWQYPFTLDRGKVAVKAAGNWAKKNSFHLSAFVSVTNGDGVYKKFLFKGLNVRQDLVVFPRLYSKSDGSFSLQHLVGAIDITDIQSKLNFSRSKKGRKPQIIITDFQAALFDGRITCPKIIYDLNQPETTVAIDLKNIDLAQIIELVKMNNLQVTGKIHGSLPVTLSGKDISMKKGLLLNELPGGEIHYTAAGIDASSMTGYALKAVENFQYNSLKATASYLPSGQLALDISLQGHSPSLDTDRPVHFNIHAEQNLPALMQSLRFSKGLTDELDKRVKRHYK
jgi:hypothetical protein